MIKNYIKIAWRNLFKNKVYSFINIGGLAVGMAVAILIGLWIYDELAYNKYHQNYNNIAKVMRFETFLEERIVNDIHVTGLGTLLKSEYTNHFKNVAMVRAGIQERVLANGNKKFTQDGYFVQSELPQMLSLKMIFGSIEGLNDMNSILLSESLAKKLFGNTDPTDNMVMMDASSNLKVTGVYADLPKNSEFKEATYLAPLDLYINGWATTLNSWDNNFINIYVQLHPGHDFSNVSDVIKDVTLKHLSEKRRASNPEVFLHPMSDWHLHSKFENGIKVLSDQLRFVWLFGIIGVFVLVLACINFMNLSTARSAMRSKEVGIRKTIGSNRSQLINQFLSESILVATLAFCIALFIVVLTLGWFNEVAGKEMMVLWANPWFWFACLGFTLFTALLAGSYPAFYLSSFKPVKVLKGVFKASKNANIPRQILVMVQFTVSIVLIIGSIIVFQQIQHIKNRPVGYTPNGLIALRKSSPEFDGKYQLLRSELKQTGVVEEMGGANYPVTSIKGWNHMTNWKGKSPEYDPSFNTIKVSHEYGKTVGWEVLSGRDFSREFSQDQSSVVINESALKLLGLENPVGEVIKFDPGWGNGTTDYTIVGVVKDMIKGSPFEATHPSIIFLDENASNFFYIRINPNVSVNEAIQKIGAVLSNIVPSAPFDFTFADEDYAAKFQDEERIGKLAGFLTILAVFISCLGLFGLASFVAEQRTKEIGIRKILGATVTNLWAMLSKDFVILVLTSCFIAIPVSWYFLNGWLKKYEFHTEISWTVFAAAGFGSLLLALTIVSFQSIKVALQNPVESLRSE